MTDENDDLEQTFKRINNPADLVDAIQNLIDNPDKVNYIPAHMRGNVRIGSDGIHYFERNSLPLDVWNKVYIKVISCYLRLRGQGHKLPSLPDKTDPDPIINLQTIQDKCLDAQEIVLPKGICTHSPTYLSVVWNSQPFTFNAKRAKIIKLLWESETPIHQDKIAAAINTHSDNYRLIDSFRSHGKKDPAWDIMIEHTGDGFYTLRKKPKNPTV